MLLPVILSGGAGTRLWPVSREAHPKPFMKMGDGATLIQKAFERAAKLSDMSQILTVTNRELYFPTQDAYHQMGSEISPFFILEPFGRNTAPAIMLAALYAQKAHGKEIILLVFPADHVIEDQQGFQTACRQAEKLALQNKLVTFGVKPTKPEAGFGYIEKDASEFGIKRFVEKPSYELSEQYVRSGNYFWNSGMFCFKASTLLAEMKQHAPKLLKNVEACWVETQKKVDAKNNYVEIDREAFTHIPDISIDYALMEKSQNVAMVTASFDWNDIGSWDALSKTVQADSAGNSVVGEAILLDTTNTFVQSEERIIAAIGVNNLLIVDTHDALLVVNRDSSQDVKKVVQQLKLLSHESYKVHRTVNRPWGTYTILEEGLRFKIKRIVVRPGASLSLQKHRHRSEHWVVVSGTAEVMNNDKRTILKANESTFIAAENRHRLSNPGAIDLVMIEVQTGEYLGEDDIVRLEDQYGRAQ